MLPDFLAMKTFASLALLVVANKMQLRPQQPMVRFGEGQLTRMTIRSSDDMTVFGSECFLCAAERIRRKVCSAFFMSFAFARLLSA